MTAVFITGTGTDVGKTFVATGLIRALRREGRAVDALKPVVTGFDPSAVEGSDPARLLAALGRPLSAEALAEISPWRFRAPRSPAMAAEAEECALDVDAVIRFCREAVAATSGTLLIEGVGGIMVPLDERRTVLDWMAALGLPLIFVAGSYLGTLSHTLSALDVLARRDLKVAAVAVSESANATVPFVETVRTLGNFVRHAPVFMLPRVTGAVNLRLFEGILRRMR